jgi:hypothetical protein
LRGLIDLADFIVAFYSSLYNQYVLLGSLTIVDMFTPIETSAGAFLIHLAVSTLLLNNGEILGWTAILWRGVGIWDDSKISVSAWKWLSASLELMPSFQPSHLPSVPDVMMTTTGLLAAEMCRMGD